MGAYYVLNTYYVVYFTYNSGSQKEDVVTKLWFTHVREKKYSMVLLDNDGVRFALLTVLNGYFSLKSIRYILGIFLLF